MENKTINNYNHTLFNLPLKIQNITTHKHIQYPRRKFIEERLCEIYLFDIKILLLNNHWRPGSEIVELDWLKNEPALTDIDRDAIKLFVSYCKDPVGFLDDNKFYHEHMKDYWCFEHGRIEDCLEDFLSVFAHKTDPSIFQFYLSKLEKDWRAVFFSEPSYEDLIKSQFLCLPRL